MKKFLALVITCASAFAQSRYAVNPYTGQMDISGDFYWRIVGQGAAASRPATCNVGDAYLCNGAGCTAGERIQTCVATNTWDTQCTGGTASAGGNVNTIQWNNASALGGITNLTTNGTNSLTSGAVAFGNNGINFLNAGPTSWAPGGARPYPYWAGYFI